MDFVLDSGSLEIRWYMSSGCYPRARVESYLARGGGAVCGGPDMGHGADPVGTGGAVRAEEREGARHR